MLELKGVRVLPQPGMEPLNPVLNHRAIAIGALNPVSRIKLFTPARTIS